MHESTCDVFVCERPLGRYPQTGLCDAHYQRRRKGKTLDAPIAGRRRKLDIPSTCTVQGCDSPHWVSDFCQFHYHRNWHGRPLREPRRWNERIPGVTTRKTKQGYVHVWLPDHPAAHAPGFLCEHRWVMEQHLGRMLLPSETVHHKNGVRHDNRIENLELWVSVQPAGQRPEDLVAHARYLLAMYGDLSEQITYRADAAPTLAVAV